MPPARLLRVAGSRRLPGPVALFGVVLGVLLAGHLVVHAVRDARPAAPGVAPLATLASSLPAGDAGLTGAAVTAARPGVRRRGELTARPGAAGLLAASVIAERSLSYQGRQVVATAGPAGPDIAVVSVRHAAGTGAEVSLPGPGGARPMLATDPVGSTDARIALLARHYQLDLAGTALVAGRVCEVVDVVGTGGRAQARVYLDRSTDLPLRRDLLGTTGQVVATAEFVSLQIGPVRMPPAEPARAAGGHELVGNALALACRGAWHCPARLGASMPLLDARTALGPTGPVLHLTYGDGLYDLSLFEQRGRLDTADLAGWHRSGGAGARVWSAPGPLSRASWQAGDVVVTVLTDAPEPRARLLVGDAVRALPAPARPGVWARVRLGADRVAEWLNPFD